MTTKSDFAWLRHVFVWGTVVIGSLGACGPVESTEPVAPQPPSASGAPPFDVEDVVQRARGGSPGAHAAAVSISAERPVSVSSARQLSPAVALGSGVYLVVWTEMVPNGTYENPDIYAVRVRASDGALLDSSPLVIAQGPALQMEPAVGSDGSNFLVAWTESGSGAPQVHGTRVRASDGALLGVPARLSNFSDTFSTQLPHFKPAVSSNGMRYLVVWSGDVGRMQGRALIAVRGIQGTWVNATSGQVDPYAFSIADAPEPQPRVAFGGGGFLVSWHGYAAGVSTPDIFGARIAHPVGLIDSMPLRMTNTPGGERTPAVASTGNQFLVAWTDASNHVRAARVRISDGAVLDGAGFDLGEGGLAPVSAIYDGSDYRVLWQGTRAGERVLVNARISPTDGPVTGSELLLSPVDASSESAAAGVAAPQAGHFLVAYGRAYRIKVRQVEDVPEEVPCETQGPALTINGPEVLTLECGSGTYTDLGAQAFDGCGNPIEVHAYNTGSDASGPGPNLSAEGSYTVSYAAWTGAGSVNASRTVNVDDRMAPSLMLNGPTHMTHTCGSMWVDPGAVAFDACYGDLTHAVWHTGEVNGWAEGVYTVTYTVTDGGGNSATPVTRTVEVVDCPW